MVSVLQRQCVRNPTAQPLRPRPPRGRGDPAAPSPCPAGSRVPSSGRHTVLKTLTVSAEAGHAVRSKRRVSSQVAGLLPGGSPEGASPGASPRLRPDAALSAGTNRGGHDRGSTDGCPAGTGHDRPAAGWPGRGSSPAPGAAPPAGPARHDVSRAEAGAERRGEERREPPAKYSGVSWAAGRARALPPAAVNEEAAAAAERRTRRGQRGGGCGGMAGR